MSEQKRVRGTSGPVHHAVLLTLLLRMTRDARLPSSKSLTLAFLVAVGSHSVFAETLLSLQARLVATDSATRQGAALAVLGDQVLVGAHGAAFLWKRSEAAAWTLRQELNHPQSTAWFGESVALSEGWLVIGDEQGGQLISGTAYVFRETSSGQYEFHQMLESPTPRNQGQFGRSAAFAGQSLLIGAPLESSQGQAFSAPIDGGIHVYSLDGSENWVHRSVSRAPNLRSSGAFGLTVTAIGIGGVLVAEPDAQVPLGNQSRGAMHDCSIGVDLVLACVERVRPGGAAFERFGRSVVSTADWTIVSAPGGVGMLGTVSIFDHIPTPWTLSGTITAPEHAFGWSFGTAITRVGPNIFAAAPWRNDSESDFSGTVYHFRQDLGVWSEKQKFSIPGGAGGDTLSDFGSALSASGEMLFVGASGLDSPNQNGQGAVFVYAVAMFADGFD